MKLIIILVLSSFSLMANSQNDRFDSKVKYEYNVYLEVLNLKLGEASLSVKAPGNIDGINVYHLNFNVRTTKLGDTIYKIRNKIDVWVNQETLNVVKQNKNIRELRKRRILKLLLEIKKESQMVRNLLLKTTFLIHTH